MIDPIVLHYTAAALAIALGAIGGGIGHGYAGFAALKSMQRQPAANSNIFSSMFIGLAIIESGIIIAFIIALMIFFGTSTLSLGASIAELGMAILIGIAATAVSIASSFTVKAAAESIARQPLFAPKITTMMLLTLSIIEAPVIFAFIVALLMRNTITATTTLAHGLQACAAGMATALGSIGPSIGLGIFTHATCVAIGLNTKSYDKIFSFALLYEALIETPMIFSLVISIMMLHLPIPPESLHAAYILFAAAFSIGISTIGTSTGVGYVASRSALHIGLNPDTAYAPLFRATLLISSFIESSIIYGMVIALILIHKAS